MTTELDSTLCVRLGVFVRRRSWKTRRLPVSAFLECLTLGSVLLLTDNGVHRVALEASTFSTPPWQSHD